jgi:hypothetical protein
MKARGLPLSSSPDLFHTVKTTFRESTRGASQVAVLEQYIRQILHVDEHRALLKTAGYLRDDDITETERVRVNAARVGLGLPKLYSDSASSPVDDVTARTSNKA